MRTVCAGCGTVMLEGEPKPVSHGICFGCFIESCLCLDVEVRELVEVEKEADEGGEG